LIGAAVTLVLYTVVGFFVAPRVIRSQLIRQVGAQTGLDTTVGKVRCNPFSLELEIESLEAGPKGAEPWLGFDRFHANLQLASLWRWQLVLREVSIGRPHVLAHLDAQGQLNLAGLAATETLLTNTTPREVRLPRATIGSLAISNAVVRWRDDFIRPGFEAAVTGGRLSMTNVYSLATNAFHFEARLDGETALRATGKAALLPLSAEIAATADGLSLGRYARYLPDWSPLRLTNGVVTAGLEGRLARTGRDIAAVITDATVDVEGIAVVTTADSQPVLRAARAMLSGVTADLGARVAGVGAVEVVQPEVSVHRLKNGAIDWQVWLGQLASKLPAGDTNTPAWSWSAGSVRATNAVLHVVDAVPTNQVTLTITNALVQASGLTNDLGQPIAIDLAFELVSGGRGTLSGELTPTPPAARLRIQADDVFLPVVQPYLDGIVNAGLRNGFGSMAGDLQATLTATNGLQAAFTGSLGAREIEVLEGVSGAPLAALQRLEVSGLEVDWPFEDLRIKSVEVHQPSAQLVLREDGTSNVDDVVSRRLLEEAWRQLTAVWHALQFELDELKLSEGRIRLADESAQPPFQSGASGIIVELKGLRPDGAEPATLNVGGRIEDKAPFSVVAEFKPEGTNLTAKVSVSTQVISLPPGSTYAGRWAGYLIDQGRVSMDLRYELDHRRIKGENRVIVDDFEFGAKTGSKDAVNLPVKLGVALLKDRNNRIDLDVPVEGDLSDPQLKLGRVIWRAFANIFEKAATAPFRFLGSLIGAGADEDLGSVEFVAGSAELSAKEADKLEKLARALYQRPQLKLEIVGRFDPAADEAAIRTAKFEAALNEFGGSLATNETMRALAEALEMGQPPAREELIKLLYVKTLEIPFRLPSTNAPAAPTVTNDVASSSPTVDADDDLSEAPSEESGKSTWLGRSWRWLGRTLASNPISKRGTTPPAESKPAAPTDAAAPVSEVEAVAAPEPPPVLPALPPAKEMEGVLKQRQAVTPEELQALADQRAQAVQTMLLTKPELNADRVVIQPELEGAEPAKQQARVFLGLQ